MFSATRTSRLSLKRVPRLRLDPTPVSSTRTALILHTTAGPSPYSTSTSNANETPLSALPPLPDQAEWRKVFNPPGGTVALRERACIRNPKSARALAEGFTQWTKPFLKADEAKGKGRGAKGVPKVIIEAFPGTHPACIFLVASFMYPRFPRPRRVDQSFAYPPEGYLR